MKPKILSLTLLVLVCIAMIPVQAMSITMANPGAVSERDIFVYFPNVTSGKMDLYGVYNSTSTINLDDNTSSYIFAMKPVSANPLEDPPDWLTTVVFPFVQTNVLALLVIFILAAIWWRGGR